MSNYTRQAESSAISSIILCILFSIGAIVASLFGPTGAGIFSLVQVLLALADIEDADRRKRLFPNFVGALVTAIMGWVFNDTFAYGFSSIVIVIIILNVLDRLKL